MDDWVFQIEPIKDASSFEYIFYLLKDEDFITNACGLTDEEIEQQITRRERPEVLEYTSRHSHRKCMELLLVFDPKRFVFGGYNLTRNTFFFFKAFFFSILSFAFFFFLIYLFMAVLGLRFCSRAFSSRGKWGPPFIAVRGPPTIAAPPAAEHRLQTRRPSNCGSRAQSLHGTWDPPRPGLKPVSPALAGRLSTTAPPGKP